MSQKEKKSRGGMRKSAHRSSRTHELGLHNHHSADDDISAKREKTLQRASLKYGYPDNSLPTGSAYPLKMKKKAVVLSEGDDDYFERSKQKPGSSKKKLTIKLTAPDAILPAEASCSVNGNSVPKKRGRPPKVRKFENHLDPSDAVSMSRTSSSNSSSTPHLPLESSLLASKEKGNDVFAPAPFQGHAQPVQPLKDFKPENTNKSKVLTNDNFEASDYSSHDERDVLGHFFELANGNSPIEIDSNGLFVDFSDSMDTVDADMLANDVMSDTTLSQTSPPTGTADNDLAYSELLDWGSGDLAIDGMPGSMLADGQPAWFEDAPQYEIDDSEDDSGDERDDEDSVASSSVEAEQALLMKGLESDSEGETTDSLDDSDHAALARFGIEHDGESTTPPRSPETKPSQNSTVGQTQTQAVIGSEPALGSFVRPKAQIITLDQNNSGIAKSPFSVSRLAKRKQLSVQSPIARLRRQSSASSQSTATSVTSHAASNGARTPSIRVDRPTPPSDIPEEAGEAFMDLDIHDFLDTQSQDIEFLIEGGDSETDNGANSDATAHLSNLNRWKTVPIGAFRRQGAFRISPVQGNFSPALKKRARLSDGIYFLPVRGAGSAALASDSVSIRGIRRKISKREAIGLSPVLCPIRSPSNARSRKEKRAERKQKKRCAVLATPSRRDSLASLDGEPLSSQVPAAIVSKQLKQSPPAIAADAEVPILELPASSVSADAPASAASANAENTSLSGPAPAYLLPAPTLPSAGCVPLNSPFMTAQGVPTSVPPMSLSGTSPAVWVAQDA